MFGNLPENFKHETVELGKIADMFSGGTPSSKHPEYYGDKYPFVTTPCLGKNYISETDAVNWLSELGVEKSSTHIIPAYSVMYGSRVGVGKSSINTCEMCTNQDILSFFNIDTEKYDLLFIKKVMDQYFDYIVIQKRGSTIKGVPSDIVKALKIPMVPIDEQKMFAAFTEQSDKSKFTGFKSQFIEMFGDPVRNDKEWPTKPIKEVAPETNADIPKDNEYWWLNLDMIESYSGRLLDRVIEKSDAIGSSTHPFDDSMVLYSKLRPYLNKIFVPDSYGYATTELVALKPNPNELNKYFLFNLLRGDCFVNFANKSSSGAQMPRMQMKVLREFQCILPPMDLQNKFVEISEQADKSK